MCDIRAGIRISSKQRLQTLCRFRKKNSMVGSLSSLISKQSNLQEGRLTHVPPTVWLTPEVCTKCGSEDKVKVSRKWLCCDCVCRGDARRAVLRRVSPAEGHADVCTGGNVCLRPTVWEWGCLLSEHIMIWSHLSRSVALQDENMISFIKGGIKIRTSYQIYKWVTEPSAAVKFFVFFQGCFRNKV